jgi:hypothetical protein
MSNPKNTQALKQIDLNKKKFTANGVEYLIEGALSFERFLMYQKLQLEVGYETGFYGVFKGLEKAYTSCNDGKLADASVIIHNLMNGIKTVDNRRVPMLELVCLFINSKDEDRKVINDDMIQQKISDWEAEGLDMMPFFQLAVSSIKNFSSVYTEFTQSILEQIKSDPIKSSLQK